ncbi:hypothetical protein ACFYXS_36690 [Streptomyces sp. NPDC002574]|uniref:hypothetical protein n=1 Tax=Streptomyces sp. NPDC002574 TaxID=3364652 RepID=UPI00368EF0D0
MLTSTVCVALSAAGLAIAVLTAYRRRFARAVRIAAVALLPVGFWMTGLATLGGKVVAAVGDWTADLVFKPSVWAGFGVLALAVVLYAVGRIAGRRGRAPERHGTPAAVPGASAPALGAARRPDVRPESKKAKEKIKTDPDLAEFGEIEEILKRRGI